MMHLSFNTSELSDLDRAVLRALLGDAQPAATPPAAAADPEPEADPEPAPQPRRTRRTKAQIEADRKAAEEAMNEDADEGDEDDASDGDKLTKAEVVARATEVAAAGKKAAVKAALQEVEAERVGLLKDDQLRAFMDALEAELADEVI